MLRVQLLIHVHGGGLRRNVAVWRRVLNAAGFSVTVTALTDDGLPAEMRYVFNKPLKDRSLKWLTWSDDGFIPFVLPAVGETVRLNQLSLLWWR